MGATHGYSPVHLDQLEAQLQSSSSLAHDCHVCLALSIPVTLVLAISAAVAFLAFQALGQVPHYSVTIDHVAGLDPAVDLGRRPTLEPEFNLTLRVASRGFWATECAEPRMYATVSYHGVSLAATATLTRQICAGPREAVQHHLVARGAGVAVPGSMLDGLKMDMLSGVTEFDVELRVPGRRKMAWSCGPRLVGDVDALKVECN